MRDHLSAASLGMDTPSQDALSSRSRRSYADPASLGLAPDCEPVRKIARMSKRIARPGVFSSRKTSTRKPIRTESLLEMDGLAHIETNARYLRIAPQPHCLTFHVEKPNGSTQVQTYVPDLAVLTVEHDVIIVDFKFSYLRALPEWAELEPIIREAYRVDHGATFRVLTEEHIHVEPRRTNVAIMMMHRPMVADAPAINAVRIAVAKLGLPATIREIREVAALDGEPPIDRAFSALMELAIGGEIQIDMSQPFHDGSCVRDGVRS